MGMKDSGIEWIGEIPEEWKVKKIKYVSNLYTGNSISDDEKGCYEDSEEAFPYIATKDVSAEDSSIDYKNGMYTKRNDHSFRIAPENSTLMCIEGGSAGKKIAKTNRKVSFVNKLCCFNAKKINANYLYMYLKSEAFKEEFNQHISGLIGGVSQTELKSFYILLPMEEEQKLIADFLEDKVEKIDDILADLNKQVEILEKYKKSLITEIVTNGLNPNVAMKDSGIDWLGEIPSNWEMSKIGYLGTLQNGISKGAEFFGTGDPFVSYSNVYNNILLPEEVEGLLDSTKSEQYLYSVKENDAFFTRTSETIEEIGFSSVCKKTIPKSTFAGFLIRFRPNTNRLNMNYAKYYFRAEMLRAYFVKEMMIVTRASLGQNLLKELNVLLPPSKEQQEIADFLDKKCGQIDELIRDKKTQIEKMEGYKKSLIYEYVTGKKRVKGVE